MMRGLDTTVRKIRRRVFEEVARLGFEEDDETLKAVSYTHLLVPVFLDNFRYGNEWYRGIKTVMTIHNLKFQGTWDTKREMCIRDRYYME